MEIFIRVLMVDKLNWFIFKIKCKFKFTTFIKNNFEGIIPQGTPIAQIIPFRQENWKSQVFKGLVNLGKITSMKSDLIFFGWYKKTFWVNKKYE